MCTVGGSPQVIEAFSRDIDEITHITCEYCGVRDKKHVVYQGASPLLFTKIYDPTKYETHCKHCSAPLPMNELGEKRREHSTADGTT